MLSRTLSLVTLLNLSQAQGPGVPLDQTNVRAHLPLDERETLEAGLVPEIPHSAQYNKRLHPRVGKPKSDSPIDQLTFALEQALTLTDKLSLDDQIESLIQSLRKIQVQGKQKRKLPAKEMKKTYYPHDLVTVKP